MSPIRMISLSAAVLLAPLLISCASPDHQNIEVTELWDQTRAAMMYDMAESQFRTGDLEQAAESVTQGLQTNPRDARLYVLAGRIELERSRLERSYNAFEKAIEMVEASQAERERANKDSEAAARMPVIQQETMAQAFYFRGIVEQRWRRSQAALASYERAYEIRPDEPGYLLAAAEMYVEIDRAEAAIDLLEGQRHRFDQNASLRATLAHLYAATGQTQESLRYFREATVLDPENPKLRESYAMQLMANGQPRLATDQLETVLKSDDYAERRDLMRLLAGAYAQTDRVGLARDIVNELLRMPQPPVEDWIRSGELSWRDGDTGATLTAANRVISLAPRRSEGYTLAGMVWRKRERLEQALAMFDRAAELAPESADPLILRGLTLQEAGQDKSAAQAFDQALQRNPGDPRAVRLLTGVRQSG